MPLPSVLILGSGYTGSRVATRIAARGIEIRALQKSDFDATRPEMLHRLASLVTPGCLVLHSIPTLPDGQDRDVISALGRNPRRVIYLSTTSVYGDQETVNERSTVQPRTSAARARVETEQAVEQGPWESLILRPAAIYGPGRGIHVAMALGRYSLLGDGSNFISRIHVDDLAAIVDAALCSSLTGAYPVADHQPCRAREIAGYCAGLLNLPFPPAANLEDVPPSRRSNRRVDGSAICRELGVTLRYPSYREGIPASLAGDSATMGNPSPTLKL